MSSLEAARQRALDDLLFRFVSFLFFFLVVFFSFFILFIVDEGFGIYATKRSTVSRDLNYSKRSWGFWGEVTLIAKVHSGRIVNAAPRMGECSVLGRRLSVLRIFVEQTPLEISVHRISNVRQWSDSYSSIWQLRAKWETYNSFPEQFSLRFWYNVQRRLLLRRVER